ncbi:MAG: hypothetical protein IV097_00950 [Burkholderiaceae bacterium]|nr:hypothetical protein [Burkholderiaceae bacterium]
MSGSGLRWLLWALLLLVLPARAANYTFPGTLPPGCSGTNGTYSCGALTLAYNDTVTIASPKPAKITINGAFSTDNATINSGGQASDLTLIVTGTLTLGYQAVIRAGISAGSVQNADGYATLSGSLATTTGTLALGYLSTVNGNVSSSSGAISLAQGVVISGDVSSTSGAVSLGYQGQVSGDISSSGTITLAQASIVSGTITGAGGAVSLGYQTKVVGSITTSSGMITLDQAAIAQSCVRSTGSATITLGYQASVNSVCCGASCGNSCVVNNSNAAMPPACKPPPVAEYRFDECSYNGTTGEAKDSVGSNHATAVLGAANSGTAPTVVNRYANLSFTDGRRYFTPGSAISLSGDWTISAWVKFPLSSGGSPYHVLGAMASGGDLMYLDGNNGMRWGVYTPGNIVPGTFKLNTLSSGWHHLAVVGQGSSTKLYIDGTFKESVNAKASGSLAYIGASYDLDAGTHEGMNSGLDEYLVFASALAAADISSIYGNQAAGKNYDGSTRAAPPVCPSGPGSFAITGTGSASTCSAQTLTITARDGSGNTLTGYTGTVSLSTSTGKGNWTSGSSPTPSGTLTPGAANSGLASYLFAAGDGGVVKLRLSHTLAQDVTVTVVDATASGSSSTSAAIQYRDNAFVFAEDLNSKVSGSNIAVAGRPHDHTLSYIRRDPSTGSCGVATDYAGNKALKFWRSDSGGSWVAPTVVSPALSIPAAQPASNNLTLNFSGGVASFNLGTTDIGRYSLNVRDDSLSSAASAITGSASILTVRPFTVMVSAIKYGAVNNPNGSAAGDTLFAPAGASFSASVAAYTWAAAMLNNGADAANTGTPAASATEAAMKVGGRANSFASTVMLSPLAASQTPASGSLGSLNNGSVTGSAFATGTATVSTLQYTEVGSFALNTTGVVSNFLGSGLALNAVVVNAGGVQNTRVGRFAPASFALTSATVVHRNSASCAPASTFSYLDENFKLQFTLTARSALGATTTNYTGAFALLDLSAPAGFGLAGIQGSTTFKTTNSRLALVSSSGSWSSGVAANVQLIAAAKRVAAPDGPFDSAKFGIAATDSDGVTMSGLDLDTDSPANGNDRVLLATVPLRFGRLQLMNAIGAQNRDLAMPLLAQYWNGSGFADNTLDSCTRISSTHVNFGNYRKTLTSADSNLQTSPVTVSAGRAKLVLSKPGAGRSGSFDVGLSLSGSATASTCMASFSPVAGDAATTGAGMGYLRGAWCGSAYDKDPSAKATFGLYRGADNLLYQRENY